MRFTLDLINILAHWRINLRAYHIGYTTHRMRLYTLPELHTDYDIRTLYSVYPASLICSGQRQGRQKLSKIRWFQFRVCFALIEKKKAKKKAPFQAPPRQDATRTSVPMRWPDEAARSWNRAKGTISPIESALSPPTAQCSCLHWGQLAGIRRVLFVCHIWGSTTWIWHKPEARSQKPGSKRWGCNDSKYVLCMYTKSTERQNKRSTWNFLKNGMPVLWGYVVRSSLGRWIMSSSPLTLLDLVRIISKTCPYFFLLTTAHAPMEPTEYSRHFPRKTPSTKPSNLERNAYCLVLVSSFLSAQSPCLILSKHICM